MKITLKSLISLCLTVLLLISTVACAFPVEPATGSDTTAGTTEEQTTEETTVETTEETKDEATVRVNPLAADEPFLNLWRELYVFGAGVSDKHETWNSVFDQCLLSGNNKKPLFLYDTIDKKGIFPIVEDSKYIQRTVSYPRITSAGASSGSFSKENPADYVAIQDGKVYLPLQFANFLEDYKDILTENMLIPCIVYSDSAFMPSENDEDILTRWDAFTKEFELIAKVLEENEILYLPLTYYQEVWPHWNLATGVYVFLTAEDIYSLQSSADLPIVITYTHYILIEANSPLPY